MDKIYTILAPALACLLLAACSQAASQPSSAGGKGANQAESLELTSQSFPADGAIPAQYACARYGGSDLSPQLSWSSTPPDTKSLALTLIDPDASGFVHWLVFDIPSDTTTLAEGQTPPDAVLGRNGFGKQGYGGPCPPSGTHHYVFTLYALDNIPDLQPGASLNQVYTVIDGHVLAKGTLTGTFSH